MWIHENNTKRHIRNNVQQPIKTKERTLIVLIKIFLRSASLLLQKEGDANKNAR